MKSRTWLIVGEPMGTDFSESVVFQHVGYYIFNEGVFIMGFTMATNSQ